MGAIWKFLRSESIILQDVGNERAHPVEQHDRIGDVFECGTRDLGRIVFEHDAQQGRYRIGGRLQVVGRGVGKFDQVLAEIVGFFELPFGPFLQLYHLPLAVTCGLRHLPGGMRYPIQFSDEAGGRIRCRRSRMAIHHAGEIVNEGGETVLQDSEQGSRRYAGDGEPAQRRGHAGRPGGLPGPGDDTRLDGRGQQRRTGQRSEPHKAESEPDEPYGHGVNSPYPPTQR
ncbi:MAG: hypothetical protein R3D03_03170 [Geminicoccaceae bacterium]